MYEVQSTTWFRDDVLTGLVNSMIATVSATAAMLLISFMALKIGYEYFRASMNSLNNNPDVGKPIDFSEVARCVALLTLLGLYPALTKSVTGGIRYINSHTDKGSQTYEKMAALTNDYYYKMNIMPLMEQQAQAKKDYQFFQQSGDSEKAAAAKKLADDADVKIGNHILNNQGNSTEGLNHDPTSKESVTIWGLLFADYELGFSTLINGFLWIIAMAIKWGVSAYARVIFKLLLVIGPLAIATSIFWKDKFLTWFEGLLNTGLCFTVLNILDWIVSEYWYEMFIVSATGSDNSMGIGQSIAFNFALIGCYLSAFKLTAMWIGKPVAGAIMSKGMAVAGIIAAAAIMAATKGKGGQAANAVSNASSKSAAE